jgi:hypothetical protein
MVTGIKCKKNLQFFSYTEGWLGQDQGEVRAGPRGGSLKNDNPRKAEKSLLQLKLL